MARTERRRRVSHSAPWRSQRGLRDLHHGLLESHSAAVSQTVLFAWLVMVTSSGSSLPLGIPAGFAPLLVGGLYLYASYNLRVLGSLMKRLHNNAGRYTQANPEAVALRLDSTRLLQAGPLGALQWVAVSSGRAIAAKGAHTTAFAGSLLLGAILLTGMVLLLMAPLLVVSVRSPDLHVRAVLAAVGTLAVHEGARFFFRCSRPFMQRIRAELRAEGRGLWHRVRFAMSDWFDRGDEDPKD